MTPILIMLFIAGTVLVGGIAVQARRGAADRAAAVRDVAARLGWTFHGEVPFKMIPDLHRFELFRQGSSKQVKNAMTSPAGDPRAVLFEYSYTVSTGKSSHTYRQTVFYATSDALNLPTFSLRPETFFHGIATVFGYQDIDLEEHREFSDRFLLRGENEAQVRHAFTGRVAEFFEARRGMCAAGSGHELLYWRPGKVAGAEGIEPLIRDGVDLAQRFMSV